MRKWQGSVTTSGTYPWSLVKQIFHNGQPSHGGDRKTFEVMTSTLPKGTIGSVASLLAATPYQGNPDRNHKLCLEYRINWEIYTPYAGGMFLHINGKFPLGKLKSSLSFLTAPHCQFRGAGKGMKHTFMYICGIMYFKLNGINYLRKWLWNM